MNIKLINEGVYEVTYALKWERRRPDIDDRIIITSKDILREFESKNSSLKVKAISGPTKITNFNSPEESEGTWTINAESKIKPVIKSKTTRSKTKKEGA